MHKDGQPKLLFGCAGRDTWAGYCSHWRGKTAAREKLCCCSTEPAGPDATHLVETRGAAKGLGLHARTGEGEQWSTHLAGNPLITSAPSPPRAAPTDSAFEVFKDMRDAQSFRDA